MAITPENYATPQFIEDRWRQPFGYDFQWEGQIPDSIRKLWPTFTPEQQQALAAWAHELAGEALDEKVEADRRD